MKRSEGELGPGVSNPCPRCGRHSTQPGVPNYRDRLVSYKCPYCGLEWARDFEEDLARGDVVRVDLDTRSIYGLVASTEGDQIFVEEFERRLQRPKAYERWRVLDY